MKLVAKLERQLKQRVARTNISMCPCRCATGIDGRVLFGTNRPCSGGEGRGRRDRAVVTDDLFCFDAMIRIN